MNPFPSVSFNLPSPSRARRKKADVAYMLKDSHTAAVFAVQAIDSVVITDARPTQGRELDIEESESEEVISESSLSGDERKATETGQRASRHHVLDIESDIGTQSQEGRLSDVDARPSTHLRFDIESESPSEASQGIEMGREAKRRKVSISPTPLLGSPGMRDVHGAVYRDVNDTAYDASTADTEDGDSAMSMDDSEDSSIPMPGTKLPQQPVFQQAPRFKPLSAENAFGGLPVAFSPQRRGAKYVSGGMAAQLQGWLSEIKGWEENNERTKSVVKLHVDHVRSGRRMYLIEGREPPEETPKKWILAGEGKLTGLGKRAEVKTGSMVLIEQPTWDVELEEGMWNVACEWSVELT
ncbi:methionyl-trna formyltransferase, mitochondrial [Trichoderma arundinaceum]|uniref:Methionyl-trna formyltransferase, mitochondrial n=1 Tax=Trichoderma arundinaceum TaxID=490622 RepID=A0A395NA37_TRIAR|nr:methionyl-trna formyltransferase, mitochondrial [Trichoderma arundinaceum]